MKITTEHYNLLRDGFITILNNRGYDIISQYKDRVSPERFRWDMLHATRISLAPLYEYMDDSHIDTALRHIVKDLNI